MASQDGNGHGPTPGGYPTAHWNGTARGSLGLIEKPLGIGRSGSAQRIAFDALQDSKRIVYYVSGSFVGYLTYQMSASGMNVVDFLRDGQLRIFPLDVLTGNVLESGLRLVELENHMRRVSSEADAIIVDSVTEALVAAEQPRRDHFFSTCRELCAGGLAILTVVQSM